MHTHNHSQPLNSSKGALCTRSIIEDDLITVDYFFAVFTIILNVLTCPPIILLNTLVIIAIKTKPRLRTLNNILLAYMAGTDLAVGIIQPAFIAKDILMMKMISSTSLYCTSNQVVQIVTLCLCLVSLFHLAIIAIERYVAMKYSLRYDDIVTERRLSVAVALSWFISTVYFILRIPGVKIAPVWLLFLLILVNLLVIIFCHISVFTVSRRHEKQIKSEHVSPEAKRKFSEERKAFKTTTIIFFGVFMSYFPSFLGRFVMLLPSHLAKRLSVSSMPLTASCFLFNSLFNPIIYCWRNRAIRQAVKQLLRRQQN